MDESWLQSIDNGNLVSSEIKMTVIIIRPAPAIRQLLKITNKTLNDIDLIEVNEAFAAQTIAVERDLGLDRNKLM